MINHFSNRLKSIFEILIMEENYTSTSSLARALDVSTRTIYRELNDVNDILLPFNLKIKSKPGLGYKLDGNLEDKQKLNDYLKLQESPYSWKDAKSRRKLVLFEILKSDGFLKLSTLAHKLNTSVGTISRDIDFVRPSVLEYGIEIVSKKGTGIEVLADEENIRKAISDFVYSDLEMNLQFGLDIETNLLKYFDSQKSGILSLLDKDDLTEVIKVLINDSNDIIYRVTEFSLIGLVIHLTVAISRIRNGEEIVLDKNLLKDIKEEHMYYDAKIIASSIENKFKIKFPEDEIGYILMHLRGLRPRSVSSKIEEGLDLGNYEAMILVDRLVERFSELTDYNFNNDELLIIGLLAHLVPSLNRLRNNLEIRNPLLNEIRSEYAELFLIVKETSKLINEQEKIEISDDEIAYLTLHFGAAIERLKFNNTEARLNLGVVCASGIGISSLLSSTIKSNFPDIKNVIPLSVEEVLHDDLKERGIDLLVATLDIKSDLPTVFVNPLLREEDLNVIRKAMDGIKFTSRKDITNNLKIKKKIIDEIILLEVDLSQAFDSVLNSLIKPITEDDELTEFIKEKVKEREDIAPVIIKEKRFVLYHSSISDLNKPYVVFFRASTDRRTLLYNSIDIGALMLLPKPSNAQERYTLSNISKSLIEVEDLTDTIKHGTLKEIKEVLIESMEEEI